MNRAVGRRAMFESDDDVRRLMRRVEEATQAGWIEVHALVVLQTHFHMLVRSVSGALSTAMHFVQAPYGQWFNRTRDRDGPIHRGRFRSKVVDSDVYRRRLISYIDANPVLAGLAATPEAYPHGTARWYAIRHSPAWHSRWWVEAEVVRQTGGARYDPRAYRETFPIVTDEERERMGEAAIGDPAVGAFGAAASPPIDFLLSTTDAGRAEWLRGLATAADGTHALRTVVSARLVMEIVAAAPPPAARERTGANARRPDPTTVALLRTLSGCAFGEIGEVLDCSISSAYRAWRAARHRLVVDAAFAARVATLTGQVLAAAFGRWV
jgi:REP element-mobilizing transposase RayT